MDRQLAARILRKGKNLAPDRFPALPPNPSDAKEMLDDWTTSLSCVNLPPQVWADAVTLWATELVGDRMATPKDLIHAAYRVRDKWEQHPGRRAILEDHRAAVLEANYARMGLADPDTTNHREVTNRTPPTPATRDARPHTHRNDP